VLDMDPGDLCTRIGLSRKSRSSITATSAFYEKNAKNSVRTICFRKKLLNHPDHIPDELV